MIIHKSYKGLLVQHRAYSQYFIVMEYNLEKLRIAMLYTCSLGNIVHALHSQKLMCLEKVSIRSVLVQRNRKETTLILKWAEECW